MGKLILSQALPVKNDDGKAGSARHDLENKWSDYQNTISAIQTAEDSRSEEGDGLLDML